MLLLAVLIPLVTPQVSPRPWIEWPTLRSQPAPVGDESFGVSVAHDGDRVLVGASGARDNGVGTGAAYVFRRSDRGWLLEARLVAPDGEAFDGFGRSVALDGCRALIGTSWVSSAHKAYVFRRDGTTWVWEQTLRGSGGFGDAVALDGDTALVGSWTDRAPNFISGAGSASFFEREGHTWSFKARVYSSAPSQHAQFGNAVAVEGDLALIGARLEGTLDFGAAYLFARREGTWTFVQRLVPDDANAQKRFGWSVALSGSVAFIGAPQDDENQARSGAAYVFKRDLPGPWRQAKKLKAALPRTDAYFGLSLDADSGRVAIGAPLTTFAGVQEGAAYVFRFTDRGWREEARVRPAAPGRNDFFGFSVAVDTDDLFVGAIYDAFGDAGYVSHFRPGAAASARIRTVVGNLDSYRTSEPRLGSNWTARVDLSASAHRMGIVLVYDAPANRRGKRTGTLMVGGTPLFRTPFFDSGGYTVRIPDDPALAGLALFTQALHVSPHEPPALSNAVDLVVGY